MRVLAFDPGKHLGFSVLDNYLSAPRPMFIDGGELEPTPEAIVDVFDKHAERGDVVAIEGEEPNHAKPAHKIRKGGRVVDISGPLQDMMRVAGLIQGIAVGRGCDVVWMPARKWRRALTNRANASDQLIATKMPLFVSSLPIKSNAHLRDAIGVGYGALMQARWP